MTVTVSVAAAPMPAHGATGAVAMFAINGTGRSGHCVNPQPDKSERLPPMTRKQISLGAEEDQGTI